MVRQFADPYAFARELVQNGIDAGATRIEVTLERGPDGLVRTSVGDDGCGMTRATLEGPLLTLFSSSKESDSTKIGKYGVGFVSVFAVEPARVEVRTRRAGEAWLVRLFPDHSYELVTDDAGKGDGHGSVVTLVQEMDGAAYELHARRCAEALARWCRFARVPIVLRDLDAGGAPTTINEPMRLPGLVSVAREHAGERIVVACGAVAGLGGSFAGYYNRGLTLLETSDAAPGLAGVRVAIDSPKLSHTLSRDTVKQDGELRRTLAEATRLVRRELRRALAERIAEAARTGAAEYAALLEAADVPAFEGAAPAPPLVPLLDAVDGEGTMSLDEVVARSRDEVLVGDASTPMSRALARAGHPVVRGEALMPVLRRFTGARELAGVAGAFAYAAPTEAHREDAALATTLAELLDAAGRPVRRVLFASFEGAHSGELFRAIAHAKTDGLCTALEAAQLSWSRTVTLFLNGEHAAVRLARRRARRDPRIAAHLLARVVVLAAGALEPAVVDALLAGAGSADG
jgi:hypothetical protein